MIVTRCFQKKITFGYFSQTAANNSDYAQEIDSQHVKNAVLYQDGCFQNKVNVHKILTSSIKLKQKTKKLKKIKKK